MNTYETMKHNIPEGATHYYHNGASYGFVKKEACATGRDKSFIWVSGKWVRGVVVSYAVKPIPPQPTYRYEKVTDSIFDLKEEFERGELFSFDGDGHEVQIETEGDFSYAHVHENLYRRIEVTERELFIEEACKRCGWQPGSMAAKRAGKMFDAGCRFVNGKG